MKIISRCAACAKKGIITLRLQVDGTVEWRKGDSSAIAFAESQIPLGCQTDGIAYIPFVLFCDGQHQTSS